MADFPFQSTPPGLVLLEVYRQLCPGVQVVYLIPDMERFAKHNPYLKRLYAPLLQDDAGGIRLRSSSRLSPMVVFRRMAGEKSVLHHHWFECHNLPTLLHLLWKLFWIAVYRAVGGKVVWTVHNKQPHHGRMPRINGCLRRLWARLPHRLHVHCQEAVAIMAPFLGAPEERFVITAHPEFLAQPIPVDQARQELIRRGYLPERVANHSPWFLMFGAIAAYKGIAEVVELFREADPRRLLLIAGAPKREAGNYLAQLQRLCRGQEHILLIPQHIPESDVPLFLSATDYVVFNYRDVLTSGGAELARRYGRKLILPRKGCLKEWRGENILSFDTTAELKALLLSAGSSQSFHRREGR